MASLWYAILCVLLVGFAVLDGFTIGAGALHLMVARPGTERREVVAAIGPLWSWHEVWLVAAGGVLFVAFPKVLAASFAGYYLAMMMLLWALVLRGVSLEVGGHVDDAMWQTFWDAVLGVSSAVLAILLGAALGNVIRGVPLGADGSFSMALFTNFRTTGQVGLLDWYTLSTAVFTLVALSAHGATYLAFRSTGLVHKRSLEFARGLWAGTGLLLPVITIESAVVRPDLFIGMATRPLGWLALSVVVGGAAMIFSGIRSGSTGRAVAGSAAFLAGLLSAAAVSVYPVLLYPTIPGGEALTVENAASGAYGLGVAILWWPVAMAFTLIYAGAVVRWFRGAGSGEQGAGR
ncbi:MAG: cytochrome d ubiquinol oxidase subunit II [Gemmatimonadales bacterium]